MTGSDQDVKWKAVPGFSSYEASWDGEIRSVDRTLPSGRRLRGTLLKSRLSNKGYSLVNMTDDEGERQTRTVHTVILATFARACPAGQEARHLDDDPQNNRWRPGTEEESRAAGGNLMWGTKREQYRDKMRNGGKPPVAPAPYECLNHARCGGMVRNPGRRCVPCVEQVGRDAAAMLEQGESLDRVARHFGYTGTEWVYSLAVQHGGYGESRQAARAQRRSWSQRVVTTLRARIGGGVR